MRGEGSGAGGNNVVFRNIRVEDSRPTLQHFMIAMQGVSPWSDPATRKRGAGDLSGILFQNIEIAAPSVLGEPDVLWGMSDGWIRDLVFDNVTIAGVPISSIDHFYHNEYVTNLVFLAPEPDGFELFETLHSLTNGPGGDDDDDGVSNFGEYALNGNPTNPADRGLMEFHHDSPWFVFVHASNVVDSTIRYPLISRTNLISGVAETNSWDAQTFGPVVGDYAAVSNYYSTVAQSNLFLHLNIERVEE
jgi:hypothetical protein